jgi:2-phosphosulfolactate phosphatase
MSHALNVYSLASRVESQEFAGGTVVVIDVLRASTTIAHALNAGASDVIPCLEIEDARTTAGRFPEGQALLGGERQGLPIEGFDLSNTPADYTPERVRGRTIVFTTTNGTRAMEKCRLAGRVLIGAFVNARAVVQELLGCRKVHLLCAGTRGQFGPDDFLLGGLLVDRLLHASELKYRLNAEAITARESWTTSFPPSDVPGNEPIEPERLARKLCESLGGKNLTALGLEKDILMAAQIDSLDIVPELDTKAFKIRVSGR